MEVLLSKEYVYSLLEEKRMAKADFAKQMGISRTNLDALLDSKKKDINVVIKMSEVLGMSLQEFIGFTPSEFKIKGFVKVGEQVREIKTEEDWYLAEKDSGTCSVPYYTGFNDACDEMNKFLNIAIKQEDNTAMMGRINGEVVFSLSVIDDYETNPENLITEIVGKLIILSILSSSKGVKVITYDSVEYAGDNDFMIDIITAEIKGYFENQME